MLTPTNKTDLLKEFKGLKSIKQKFDFWETKLNVRYVFYHHAFDNESSGEAIANYVGLEDFKIYAKDGDESLEFNTLLLETHILYFESIRWEKKLFDLEILKSNFEQALTEKEDKKAFIEYEIKQREQIISDLSKRTLGSRSEKHQHFKSAYENQIFNSTELDLSQSPYSDISDLVSAVNGNTLGMYMKHLKKLLSQQAKDKPKKVVSLNQEQQFLMLEYLGVFEKLRKVKDPTNKKKGDFVGLLIDKNQGNCKTMFSHLGRLKKGRVKEEKKKVKENLTLVAAVFEDAGLKSIAKMVLVDLKNADL